MSSPQLNYAEKHPWHHHRFRIRYLAGAVIIAFIVTCAWWVPVALRHVDLLYWQSECLSYSAPADELVYDHARSIQLVPRQWAHFYSLFSPPGFQSEATVFMHELKKENGESRLVIVDFIPTVSGNIMQFSRVFVPGSPGRLPQEIAQHRDMPELQFPQDDTLLFSGHVDPSNPNHFTFRVQQGKNQSLYHGWLQNNETVIIDEEKPLVTSYFQPQAYHK